MAETTPPQTVLDLFKSGRFMDAARAWSEHEGVPLAAASMWCLNWLDQNAKVRSGRARAASVKYCNDIPGRKVSDCIHCGDECRG